MTQEFFNPQELHVHLGIREGMKIADFGSGSGEIAVAMATMVGKDGVVTALDVLPSAIESVLTKAKQSELANVVAARADLEVLGGSGLQEDSQDIVFMANILWQSKKQIEILEEAKRVLKRGGLLAAIEWKLDAPGGPPKEMRVSDEMLQDMVKQVGLTFTGTFPAGSFQFGLTATK